jgi:hypothetical protein
MSESCQCLRNNILVDFIEHRILNSEIYSITLRDQPKNLELYTMMTSRNLSSYGK